MELTILYWHWIVAGVLISLLEIALPSFTLLWFGLGAITVGVIVWIIPTLSLTFQVILWALLSSALTLLWFRYIKPLSADKTKAGLSREALIGEVGQVIQPPVSGKKGVVRFTTPLLGADEWQIICDTPLETGQRVRVVDLSGNALIVTPHNTHS